MQAKVLIVEDDKNISKLIKYNLEKNNFNCFVAYNTEEAEDILKRYSIDLIILDIMLPGMDGFEFCKLLRQDEKTKQIPIIMLTAKAEEIDRIIGFELGADDYIVKPFSIRELILRVKAVLRRTKIKPEEKDILKADFLEVNILQHKVTVDGKEIELTPMEFKLLVALMKRPGWTKTRKMLLEEVWDIYSEVNTRTVDTHIKRLREKLGKAGKFIKTVVGFGYKFEEEDED